MVLDVGRDEIAFSERWVVVMPYVKNTLNLANRNWSSYPIESFLWYQMEVI